jgi:hypothetical protein
MIRHPEIAAWYEKEDITFITLARSHVTFENSAKEVKKLKPQKIRMTGFPKKKFHHPISEDVFGYGQ